MDHESPVDSLQDAVDKIQHVKVEHREILEKIALDPGMSPETRWELIAHLYDEEDEHVQLIQSFLQNKASPVTAKQPQTKGLTVGSLRNIPQ